MYEYFSSYLCVHHVCYWFLRRPEEGIWSPEIGIIDSGNFMWFQSMAGLLHCFGSQSMVTQKGVAEKWIREEKEESVKVIWGP